MNKIILIAEDYADARSFMKFFLESFGYQVFEAANGLQAVEFVKRLLPNLILMDISMPIMDGLTATEIIRKVQLPTDLPIIAVTAYGNEIYRQAIAVGCNGLIKKPVDIDEMKAVLDAYFH